MTRLVEAYRAPSGAGQVGAVLYPVGAAIGAPFERSAMNPLRRALLAGVIANNPYMAIAEEHQDATAGHAAATAENAILWGHPLGDGNSYVLETGVLVRTTSYNRADESEPLPPVAAPVELPSSLFGGFDEEVASATHAVITSEGLAGRRLDEAWRADTSATDAGGVVDGAPVRAAQRVPDDLWTHEGHHHLNHVRDLRESE